MGAQIKAGLRLTLAYVAAAFSACFVSIALFLSIALVLTLVESTTGVKLAGNPIASFYLVLEVAVVTAVIATPIAGLASFIPILLVQIAAEKFSIRSRWYYIVAGALTGLLLSPLALALATNGLESASLALAAVCVGAIVPGGATGGFVFWLIDRRHPDTEARPTPSAS